MTEPLVCFRSTTGRGDAAENERTRMTSESLTYSNPRMKATIENWPSGSKRVTAHFEIEQTLKGERAVRTTTGDPKKLTYAKMMRIVDGSDGRTYIAEYTSYGFIVITKGDMKYTHETIHSDSPRYAAVLELFAQEATA
jgi:hypothetical protein